MWPILAHAKSSAVRPHPFAELTKIAFIEESVCVPLCGLSVVFRESSASDRARSQVIGDGACASVHSAMSIDEPELCRSIG